MTKSRTVINVCLLILAGLGFTYAINAFKDTNDKIIAYVQPDDSVIPMPLVQDSNPPVQADFSSAPQEQRDEQFRKYLASSVKISVSGASGSGTIIYYDSVKNEAWVISCGHLWDGSQRANESMNNGSCKITTWYHNDQKLPSPRTYSATVVFWSNVRGYDCSLLRFTPDWTPDYFPIAALDYNIATGSHQHSCGCDGGGEVAHYDVEIVGMRGNDLITTKNSPRPGRSGGGLLSDDNYFIGICWGTSDTRSGGGIGYFTPLSSIHKVYSENGFGWLLNINKYTARNIPVFDYQSQTWIKDPELIPIPMGRPVPLD